MLEINDVVLYCIRYIDQWISPKNREQYLQLAMFRPTLRQCGADPVAYS